MRVLLANPRGFCSGVDRAISIVNRALYIYGSPIYVRHEIVHNSYVVKKLIQKGIVFIEHINQVPDNSILIFSAHGVSQAIYLEAYKRNLNIFDATCPLVKKVHIEVFQASKNGKEVIFIGNAKHPEVEGTIGQYNNPSGGIYLIEKKEDVWKLQVKNSNNLSFMTQTTLSVDDTFEIISALYSRFPNIIGPRKQDICYATVNRQEAVYKLSKYVDLILVIGSKNSSNSTRLVEISKKYGKQSYLIDNVYEIQKNWIKNINSVGITAGASAPEILVYQVINYLKKLGVEQIKEMSGKKEDIYFKLPKNLK